MPTAAPSTRTSPEQDTQQPVPWNVVLLNDDHHTYQYVIRMMKELFAHTQERAQKIAEAVDKDGRAVCLTTHKERAELKRDQILAYGKDELIEGCAGAMSAIIEPAEFGSDDDAGGGAGSGDGGGSGGSGAR